MDCPWQHIYSCFDPIALAIGPIVLYWYALLFLLGWLVAFAVAWRLAGKGEFAILAKDELWDFCFWLLVGTLIGARFGYALFYYPSFFWEHPWLLVLPFDFAAGQWVGIAGMSYHGGAIGLAIALIWYAKKKGKNLWRLADLVAFAAPLGIAFGRLGNFLNQELPGRITDSSWGIAFDVEPAGSFRHPVVLYEALGEGVFLWLFLFLVWRFQKRAGSILIAYLSGYGLIRFFLEYLREPDPQIGFLFPSFFGGLTLGQLFSLGMVLVALLLWSWRRKYATMDKV